VIYIFGDIFWDMTPCILMYRYQNFGRSCLSLLYPEAGSRNLHFYDVRLLYIRCSLIFL